MTGAICNEDADGILVRGNSAVSLVNQVRRWGRGKGFRVYGSDDALGVLGGRGGAVTIVFLPARTAEMPPFSPVALHDALCSMCSTKSCVLWS